MDRLEALFLINQMRHRELLQFSEKERLIKKMRREPTQTKNLPRSLSLWIRMDLLEKNQIESKALVEHGTTNPCSNKTQTQLR